VRFIGDGPILAELRAGFTTFFADPLVVPALIIVVLYACLYMFGTGIYLDSTWTIARTRTAFP
jgi:hypothetical protein